MKKVLLLVSVLAILLAACGHRDPILKSKLTDMVAKLDNDMYFVKAGQDLEAIMAVDRNNFTSEQRENLTQANAKMNAMAAMFSGKKGFSAEAVKSDFEFKKLLDDAKELVRKTAASL